MGVVVGGGDGIDFNGVFWHVCTFFGGGWYGYTGKTILSLYGRYNGFFDSNQKRSPTDGYPNGGGGGAK